MNRRDLILKRRVEQDKKQDTRPRKRSVIVTSDGSRTLGGDPWADENNKIVWHQLFGSGGIGRAKCTAITNPEVGLGVEVARLDDRLAEWEVIGPDPLLRLTATDSRNYGPTGANDLQPGGRLFMWLYSKALLPLATFPNVTGLFVNVVGGSYPYGGARKTLTNQFNITLTQNPNAGEHYFAGLYLDANNTVQVVYGASVPVASTPPEPAWPAGAFQLSVVRVNDTQTSIKFAGDESSANDIFDRRMLWADLSSFISWPFDKVLTVSTTNANADYSTIQAANDAATSFDTILLDSEAFTETVTLDEAATILLGWGELQPSIGSAVSNTPTVNITSTGILLRTLRVHNTASGAAAGCVQIANSDNRLNQLILSKLTGTPTTGYGVRVTGGGAGVLQQSHLIDLEINVSAGTSQYGVLIDTAASNVLIEGGIYNATTADIRVNHADAVVHLNGPTLLGGGLSIAAGTVTGHYYDANGDLIFVNNNYVAADDVTQRVINTSGATASADRVGYITYGAEGLEFKFSVGSTVLAAAQACVVVVGGANNAEIKVATRGRFNLLYTGTAPTKSQFLVFSGTSGAVVAQAFMSPDVIAVAMADGAGGVVDAKLLTGRKEIPASNSLFVFAFGAGLLLSNRDFVATLNGNANDGTKTFVYNAPSAGHENNIALRAAMTEQAIFNVTDTTTAWIASVNAGTNTVTCTSDSDLSGWANGETVNIRSTVCDNGGSGGKYFGDFRFNSNAAKPDTATAIILSLNASDASGTQNKELVFHPWQTFASAGQQIQRTQVANITNSKYGKIPIIDNRICIAWAANATQGQHFAELIGWEIAIP